jgi:DNA repair photolyase
MKLVANPPNPWKSEFVEWIDAPPPAELQIFEETAKTVVSENESPDVGFRFSLNPYRGCFHACAYCYARPTHQYWDFGAGTDFERKLIVKVNAPEKLRETFMKKSWKGELLVLSGNTDCYQPLEVSYALTRRCLEVCREFRNPVGLITKSALIRRDIDVLAALAREARAYVHMSIAFADDQMARKIEPNAPAPSTRFAAMKALSEAGIPVGVGVAPIIPGLNDSQVAEILERSRENGATRAFRVMLRLPSEVKPVFLERLQEAYPDRAQKVINAVKEMRDGKLYNSTFGERGKGSGQRWDAIEWLFDLTCKRVGLNRHEENDMYNQSPQTFRRPNEHPTLF